MARLRCWRRCWALPHAAEERKCAGFTLEELYGGGYSVEVLKASGFTLAELKEVGTSLAAMKASGASVKELLVW